MSTDTRHLRARPTRRIDETQFAEIVGQVIGPPGLARHAPISPALFPAPRPLTKRLAGVAPPVALAGGLALMLLLGRPQPTSAPIPALMPEVSTTTTATATAVPPPTETATRPASTTPSITVTPTTSATATATMTIPPPDPPTTTPRPAPVYIPPTATPRPVVQLPPPAPTQVVAIPAITPGSGPAGGDWSDSIFARSATISGTPSP